MTTQTPERFELRFAASALKEWNALDKAVRMQFWRKLEKLLVNPRVPSMKLSGYPDCYRIKLRRAGFRAVYHVSDRRVVVTVIRVGRRDKNDAYDKLDQRLQQIDQS